MNRLLHSTRTAKTTFLSLLWFALFLSFTTSWAQSTTSCGNTLWTWGANFNGQLGNGTTTNSNIPLQSGTAADWKSISAGENHTVGIKTDGSLWTWGFNLFGQLGDGTITDSDMPIRVGTSTDWKSISANGYYTVGIKTDGSLWAWGNNLFGQLGNGTITDNDIPIRVGTATDWKSISAGGGHTVAIKTDGSLWAWGANFDGALGNGTITDSNIPIRVGTSTDWKSISAGGGHTVATKTDGSLWAWGRNLEGQLGNGTTTDSSIPIQIGTATDWESIETGLFHTIAIKTDGSLWAWGANVFGELGNGTNTNSNIPIQIGTATDWKSISAGYYCTLAIKTDGSLWAWGRNQFGELGNGTNTDSNTPTQIDTATDWKSISAGFYTTVALKALTPPVVSITSLNTNYCKNTPAVTLTGTPAGGTFKIDETIATAFDPSVLIVGNHTVTHTYSTPEGCTSSTSQVVEVKDAPNAPFSVSFVDCGSTLPKAHSIPYGFNQTFEWYANPNRTGDIIPSGLVREVQDGETSIVSDFVFNRGATTLNTSYYVFEKGSNGCYSPATEVPITVYPVPQTTPNIVTNFACGSSFTFEALPNGNNTIEWRTDFRAIFFGETLGTENSYTLLNPENKRDSLWVFEVSPNKCYGAPALVRIFPTPPAPVVSDISLCVGDASKLIFTNPDYRWYTAATGDFPRFPAAEIAATAPSSSTFYIGQIVDGCVSAARSELKATVNPIPSAPVVTDVEYCQNETAAVLTAGGENLKWYDADGVLLDAAPKPSTSIVGEITYFVSQILNNCESPKAVIHVKIKARPSTPSVSSVTQPTCSISTGKIVLMVQTGVEYSFDNGLTYSILNEKSGLNTGDYSIKVKNAAGCESDVLTVKINAAPSEPSTPSVSSVMQPSCSISTGKIVLNTQTGVEYSFDNGVTYGILNEKSGLNAGEYLIKIKTAEGCESDVLTVKINAAPSAPNTPSVSSLTQPTCSVLTGKIVINAQNGVEYSFDNGVTYGILNEKLGLIAGDYLIKIKSAEGCESDVLTVKINAAPNAPIAPTTSSVTQPTCSISTGKIVLTAQTGVEYSFDNGVTYGILNEKSGLIAGEYLIKIKSAEGCESEVLTVKINAAPSAPSIPSLSSVTQPTCSISTGKIVLNTQNGVEYSFDNGVTYGILNEKSGLVAGEYLIKIISAEGCESDVLTVKINAAPSAPSTPSVLSITQPTCSVSTGKIVLTAQTGVEYSFDNGLTYSILNEKSGLVAGEYLIKIKTAEGCESDVLTVKINAAPSAPSTPSVLSVKQPTCSISTGKIVLTAQTGVEYSFDNGLTYSILNEKSNLIEGDYLIKIKSAEGCESEVLTVKINAAPSAPIAPTTSSVTQPTCSVSTGKIVLTAQTGIEYSFDNGVTYGILNEKSGLIAGEYLIKIKSAGGCESDVLTVKINAEPSAPIAPTTSSVTQPTCSVSTGKIVLNTQNGVEYSFDNGLTYSILNEKFGLIAGDYSIKVKNASGCESGVLTVKINAARTAPSTPSVSSVTQPSCSISTGKIVLTAQTGVEYSFDNGVTYGILNEKSGLIAGDYLIKIRTAEGCESDVLTVKVNASPSVPSTPSVSSVTQPSCSVSTGKIVLTAQTGVEYSFDNGLTYQISNEKTGLNADDYSIKVKNASGCESGILTVKINAAPTAPSTPSVSSVTQPTCSISTGKIVLIVQTGVEYSFDNGLTYQISNEKTGLNAGDYFIKVKNASGCESGGFKVTINPTPVAPSTPSVLSVVHATCSVPTGTISINVQTGVQYSFDNGASYQTSNIKGGLASGTYKIKVKNTAGCESAAIDVVVNGAVTSLPAWNIYVTQPTCTVPKGTITVTYPPSGYLYSFDNGASFQPSNTKSGLAVGTYSVVIKNYSGCVSAPKIVNIVAPVNTATNSIVASKTSVCSGETVKLNVAPYSPVCIYKWSNGGTTDPIYVNPIATTTYTVTVTNGGCTSVASKTIIVYPKLAKPKVTIIQPTCGTMGTITITNLPVGASSKINGTNWTLGKTVYNNLSAGNYTIKFKIGECESDDEKIVLNNPGFNFDPTKCYKIVNKNSGKVLDVFQNKTANNIPIIQYALNGGGNQKWQFSYTSGGYLKIKVQSSSKYLACHDSYNGANVYQYDYYSGGQKDWAIECVGNGDFRIVHRYSGKYLSVENNSKSDAAKVEIRNWMNLDAQKWQIVEVPCATSANLRQAGYMTAKAEAEVKQVNITWYSNMGYKTDFYAVEKFNEQKAEFEEISTLNNTQYDDELHYFTYSDISPAEGDNVYRIKAVFNDGTTQLSPSLKVAFGNIKDVRLFPNPAADFIEVLLNDAPKNVVTLTLNNMLGLPVIQKSYENEQRMYFEIKDIPNGIYQLHISQKGKRSMVKQVVIQK